MQTIAVGLTTVSILLSGSSVFGLTEDVEIERQVLESQMIVVASPTGDFRTTDHEGNPLFLPGTKMPVKLQRVLITSWPKPLIQGEHEFEPNEIEVMILAGIAPREGDGELQELLPSELTPVIPDGRSVLFLTREKSYPGSWRLKHNSKGLMRVIEHGKARTPSVRLLVRDPANLTDTTRARLGERATSDELKAEIRPISELPELFSRILHGSGRKRAGQ